MSLSPHNHGSTPARIGEPAPDFMARTTHGEIRLSDFRGHWLVFFSHPADFTPVCTSEFLAFAEALPSFEALDCALLGLSVDSVYAHLAWIAAIRQATGVEIPFPIIEDPSMIIGRAYGMIDGEAGSSGAVRATYVLDPAGIIRATNCYPASVGRSIDEILRLLKALQACTPQRFTPANWQPDDPMLCAPADTLGEMAKSGDEPWFYRKAR